MQEGERKCEETMFDKSQIKIM